MFLSDYVFNVLLQTNLLGKGLASLVGESSVRTQKNCAKFSTGAKKKFYCDLTRGRTWNLLITGWIVVKRLAIGPLGQLY
jgi:hypothetical protein